MFVAIFFNVGMNVYPDNMLKTEPHLGQVCIILHLTVTFILPIFQIGTFDNDIENCSFNRETCDYYIKMYLDILTLSPKICGHAADIFHIWSLFC